MIITLKKGTFEQDIVLTGKLDPADYGFPPQTTRIQLLTEMYSVPAPAVLTRTLRVETNQTTRSQMATPDLIDHALGFGKFVMGAGRAFSGSPTNRTRGTSASVAKDFQQTQDGRTFLIESVEYPSIKAGLDSLPVCSPPAASEGAKLYFKNAGKGLAGVPAPPKASAHATLPPNGKKLAANSNTGTRPTPLGGYVQRGNINATERGPLNSSEGENHILWIQQLGTAYCAKAADSNG